MLTKILTSSLLFLVAIGGFFVSVENNRVIYIENASAETVGTGFGGVGTDPSVSPNPGGGITPSSSSKATEELLNKFVTIWNTILQVITMVVPVFVSFTSWLMSPDWTSGDLFRLRGSFYKMWVVIANIVYFIYAILLIMIALATILGKDNFNYKTMLPRLALGLLMVPFTWWFVQWTISLSAVVTASAISLPSTILSNPDSEGTAWWNAPKIPDRYEIDDGKLFDKRPIEACTDATCSSPREFTSAAGGMYGPLVIYAYGVFNMDKIKTIGTGVDVAVSITQVLNQLIMGGLMFLIFGILVILLTGILLYRAIMLWAYAIFSPLFTLHFVAGEKMFGDSLGSFDIKQFIGLCFTPAVVGIILSFGLVIVSTIQSSGNENPFIERCTVEMLQQESVGCRIDSVLTITRYFQDEGSGRYRSINTVTIGTMTIVFKGKGGFTPRAIEEVANSTNGTTSALDAGGGIFGTLILDVIAIVFVWMSFMAVGKMNKLVGKIVQPFEDMGNKVGKMAMSAPQYMPLPIPGGSIKGAGKMADIALQIPAAKLNQQLENDPLYKKLKEHAGMGGSPGDSNRVVSAAKDGNIEGIRSVLKNNTPAEAAKLAKDIAQEKDIKTGPLLASFSPSDKKAIMDLIEKIKKDGGSNEDDNLKLAALLSGKRAIDITNGIVAREALQKQYNENKQGKGGAAEGAGASGNGVKKEIVKSADGKTSEVHITIGDTIVKFDSTGRVGPVDDLIKNAKGKWTKEDLEKELKKILTEDDAKKIIDAIDAKKDGDFYKKST